MRIYILLTSALFLSPKIQAQVQLHKTREIGISASAFTWSVINYSIQFKSPKILTGNTFELRPIDNLAVHSYHKTPKTISDFTLLGTAALSGFTVLAGNRNQGMKNLAVMTQSAWLAANLTHSVKMIVQRNRPYTFAPGFTSTKRDDVYSFFSNHSAISASLLTSAFLMYGSQPSSTGKKVLISSALVFGATTAVLRISSGKHYPSDVLAGIITGMGIAWINYKIHER